MRTLLTEGVFMMAKDSNDHPVADGSVSEDVPDEPQHVYSGPNKRTSRRFRPAAKEIAAVYVGSSRYAGELIDESDSGIGVMLATDVKIRSGVRVRVAARRKCSTAVVVRCMESENGNVVGLRT